MLMKIKLLYRNVCKLPSKAANNDEIASSNINFGESTEMSPNAKEAIKEAEEQEMMESCSTSSNTDYTSKTTVVENEAIMDNNFLLPNFYVEEYVSENN